MPLHDRLHLTQYLFDHPASEWMAYWKENNQGKGWDDFLLAVKERFDPDPYEDYVGSDGNFKNRILQQAPIILNEFHDEDMAGDDLPISVTNDVVVYNNSDADVAGRKAFTLASSILEAAADSCDTGDVSLDVCFETHKTTVTTTDIMIIGNVGGNVDAHLVDIKTESNSEQAIDRECDGFVLFATPISSVQVIREPNNVLSHGRVVKDIVQPLRSHDQRFMVGQVPSSRTASTFAVSRTRQNGFMETFCENRKQGCATLRLGASDGVHVFDPGPFVVSKLIRYSILEELNRAVSIGGNNEGYDARSAKGSPLVSNVSSRIIKTNASARVQGASPRPTYTSRDDRQYIHNTTSPMQVQDIISTEPPPPLMFLIHDPP